MNDDIKGTGKGVDHQDRQIVERIEIEMPTVLLNEIKHHVQHEPIFYESITEYILYAIRREIRFSRMLKQDDTEGQ